MMEKVTSPHILTTPKLFDENNHPVKGGVKLLINNGRKTITTEDDGTFKYTYTLTKTGTNNITASFIENNKYTSTNTTTTAKVEKLATKITINPIGTIQQKTKYTISGKIVDETNNAVTGTIKLLIIMVEQPLNQTVPVHSHILIMLQEQVKTLLQHLILKAQTILLQIVP